jgi:hypothetical protein
MGGRTRRNSGQVGYGVMRSQRRHTGARSRRNSTHDMSTLAVILIVFGLTALMIFKGYDPSVITALVTATSLAAAEL